jgi:hypothetical protein
MDLELRIAGATPSPADAAGVRTATFVWFLRGNLASLKSMMRPRAAAMLASVAASLIMALMVAAAAVAIERTSDAACLAADSTPCGPDTAEWCKSVDGQMLCPGEPT